MAKTESFKIGNQVQLLSGGPVMTVQRIDEGSRISGITIYCQWFAGKKLESGRFAPDTLRHVTEDEVKKK